MADSRAVDSRASVHSDARIGVDVSIAPFCVIGPHVSIGDRCRLASHVVIDGHTELGPDNEIAPMASIGGAPQDLKYRGEPTRLVIGAVQRRLSSCSIGSKN